MQIAARIAAILNKVWSFAVSIPIIGKGLQWLATLSKEVSVSFFILEEATSIEDGAERVANTVAKRIFYYFADWGLALLSWSMVGGLKLLGVQFVYALGAMWVYDVVIATAFLYVYKRHNTDLTLGINFRRGVDAVFRRSRIAGMLAVAGVIIKAIYWDGPEHIVIFFEKELKTTSRMMVLLVILTVIQAYIWTAIIYLGLEGLGDLVGFLWNLLT
ncbi:MAG: hypothetical protein A2808_03280 [Candidatus Moranbacteria bacterium RIFCSPHIGHO2_01_FULL_55_24]|nr:MAG: hypothetical protein A2808_03280 [Candidatus Moranbacteria bacterium RIFCSPHIGHO2_01_FULL_55_24]